MVYRPVSAPFVLHQDVAAVEVEDAKLLARRMGHICAEIGRQGGP
ncbi:hypothetical protein BDIM_13510 [Brevundimonas diminuta ATCC 11568]|nr:hypothetical protein BDIM_13510 [Brevundimonas diminuta ATCC 11568]